MVGRPEDLFAVTEDVITRSATFCSDEEQLASKLVVSSEGQVTNWKVQAVLGTTLEMAWCLYSKDSVYTMGCSWL